MYNDIEIGFVGYGNQAKKIIKILNKFSKNYKFFIFQRKKKPLSKTKIIFTNKLKDLNDCKIIFIVSSSQSHFKYLEYFKKFKNYIFCEKPPCTKVSELDKLLKYKNNYKQKIFFNFNYLYSDGIIRLKKLIKSKKFGKLLYANIIMTNGIGFKKELKKNWRSIEKGIFNNIIGNLGIHHINLISDLFGAVNVSKILKSSKSKYFKNIDTANIIIDNKKKEYVNIFLSYSSNFFQRIIFTFTNGTIEMDNNNLTYYYPRNVVNKKGIFIKPKKKTVIIKKKNLSMWESSLNNAINFFLRTTQNKKKFNVLKFNNQINDTKKLLIAINK